MRSNRAARYWHAIRTRLLAYGSLLIAAWWWMLAMPGRGAVGSLAPLSALELELKDSLRRDVEVLAGRIGERNLPARRAELEQAASFIEASFRASGYTVRSQEYRVGDHSCRNLEAAVPGSGSRGEIVVVGAHYDSAADSPGADDNASGVAVLLALSRMFARTRPARTLRFVAFANEEPPYFWRPEMGSLVYARECRRRGDRITSMPSLESVGCFRDAPGSQRYPAGLGLLFPSTGNFLAFVGDLRSRPLVHRAIGAFRDAAALPSLGAALPNAVPGAGWSDHWSFWEQGYPAIEITDTALYRNPDYHTPADVPARLDYDRMARFTAAMRGVVTALEWR